MRQRELHVADTQKRQTANSLESRQCRLQNSISALNQAYFEEKPQSAVCVQHSIDSRNSAIHSAYRTLLRPSSLPEPRDPSLKIVKTEVYTTEKNSRLVIDRLSIGSCVTHGNGSDSHLRVNPLPFPEASCAHSKIQV